MSDHIQATSHLPLAPRAEEQIEGAVEEEQIEGAPEPKKTFEYNATRLFERNVKDSLGTRLAKTVLAMILLIPTLIFDIGRRIAFALNLTNGKSVNVVDLISGKVQGGIDKVKNLYKRLTTPKEITTEEQNAIATKKMQTLSARLIEGYKNLNGGYLHSNSSFSTPYALSAEKQIQKTKQELIDEVKSFAIRNGNSGEEFFNQVKLAHKTVLKAIESAAQGEIYIRNKQERSGNTAYLRNVAQKEFARALNSQRMTFKDAFIKACVKGDLVDGLKLGIRRNFLTLDEARTILEGRSREVYEENLSSGLEVAAQAKKGLIDDAVNKELLQADQVEGIYSRTRPKVETLIQTAYESIQQIEGETEQVNRIIEIADQLMKDKVLADTDANHFRASVKAKFDQAQREAEEAARVLESQRLAAEELAQSKEALLARFEGMVELTSTKQKQGLQLISGYREAEKTLRAKTKELEELQKSTVSFKGKSISILEAAEKYNQSVVTISKIRNAEKREQKLHDLNTKEYNEGTIHLIQKLQNLQMELSKLIESQAACAKAIKGLHQEVLHLNQVFKVFAKNNVHGLDDHRQKEIAPYAKQLDQLVEELTKQYNEVNGSTLFNRIISGETVSKTVNANPDDNRAEVETLLGTFAGETQVAV